MTSSVEPIRRGLFENGCQIIPRICYADKARPPLRRRSRDETPTVELARSKRDLADQQIRPIFACVIDINGLQYVVSESLR